MRTARSLPYTGISAQGWSLSRGVSVQGVSVRGDSVQGVSARETLSTPYEKNDWQTGVKTLPSRNFVCER